MRERVVRIAGEVLVRASRWDRQDLLAADPTTLVRAEETLAAMIGAALCDDEMASAIEPAGVS